MKKIDTQHIFSLLLFFYLTIIGKKGMSLEIEEVKIGVILDMDTWAGKMGLSCISLALEDFYDAHTHYKTKLVLHTRDSNSTVVGAAIAAADLLKNESVQAILGPVTSMQANFVINLGDYAQVPIISFSATNPSLSSLRIQYFIRATPNDSSQVKAISDVIKSFGWRTAVPIYADTEFGEGIIPFLTDALQEVDAHIPYRSAIHPLATDDAIEAELYKLQTMQTRVFIVHMPPPLASRLFRIADDIEMMNEGFVWIITTGITNHLSLINNSPVIQKQGILGIKIHPPKGKRLDDLIIRWKKKTQKDNIDSDLTIFGLWAYDAATALALAVERVASTNNESSGLSHIGKDLPQELSRTKFRGLCGDFDIVNGELQISSFQIVNVIGNVERGIGFWTPELRLTKKLIHSDENPAVHSSKNNLSTIIWPGDTVSTPIGWEIPSNGKKLRIGVPVKTGANAFVNVIIDPLTSTTTITGYCIDVFDAVMKLLPYYVPYELVPFMGPDGKTAGTYDDLVRQVYDGKFDAVVGDITIIANRSFLVDFTIPYCESGITMVVPIKDMRRKNAWVFLKPLTWDLWVTSICFFVFIGFVIWILEHRSNEEFSGSPRQQCSTGFWFSFSTIVFAHREKVVSHLGRFVVIIWCFVVLILTQSYTASLTSMLTLQQLEPTVTDVHDLIRKGVNVGYPKDSFVPSSIKQYNIPKSRLVEIDTLDDLEMAFSKKSADGGIGVAFDEIPYMKLFVARHCSKFSMEPILKNSGFGFVFPIGSPLVSDVNRAILKVTEGGKISEIENEWFGQAIHCPDTSTLLSSNSLSLNSFWGLFLIVGASSSFALIIFVSMLLYEHRNFLITTFFKKTNQGEENIVSGPTSSFSTYLDHTSPGNTEREHGNMTLPECYIHNSEHWVEISLANEIVSPNDEVQIARVTECEGI